MSKISTPADGRSEHAQSKGCGCGEHGKQGKERAGQESNADAVRMSRHSANDHAHDSEHDAECCGGKKRRK